MAADIHYTGYMRPGELGRIDSVNNQGALLRVVIKVTDGDGTSIEGTLSYASLRSVGRKKPETYIRIFGTAVLSREFFDKCEDNGILSAAELAGKLRV